MTVSQSFLLKSSSAKPQEELLVPPTDGSATTKDVEDGRPMVVRMHARVRVGSLTTLCVYATTLLVLTAGIISGMYIYRQFTHYKLQHFRGWCSVPYPNKQIEWEQEPNRNVQNLVQDRLGTDSPKANFFEEEFDIDIKFNQYETIEVPAFGNRRHGKFIHDFAANKTAIVDSENRRCFLMILNRNYILQPRLLFEKISKMRAGYYDADIQTVRHNMRVNPSPVSDMKNLGFYITRDCSTLPTYELENFQSLAYKRSLDEETMNVFIEFAGNEVHEYKIINQNDAIPGGQNLLKAF